VDVFSVELIDLCEHDSLPPSRRCGVILTMRPQERRESGQTDLFRARLDQIVNLTHPLVTLARTIDWGFLEIASASSTTMIPAGRRCPPG